MRKLSTVKYALALCLLIVFIVLLKSTQPPTTSSFKKCTNGTINILPKSIYHFPEKKCKQIHGSVAIVQMVGEENYMKNTVWNAALSMRCYCKMRGYHLYQFDMFSKIINKVENPTLVADAVKACRHTTNFISKRHCLVFEMLAHYDYVIHIDADTGVVNPDRCLEEFIYPEVDLHFLLRVHTNEIQSGHYILKNTTITKQFFKSYLDGGKLNFGNEQGQLHMRLSEMFLPPDQHEDCLKNHKQTYFKWVRCIVSSLRALKTGKNRLLLYSRGQTFVHDGWANKFHWSRTDFMFHAMKGGDDVVFTRKLRQEDCENDVWIIPSKKELYVDSVEKMREKWAALDKKYISNTNFGLDVEIEKCWPDCPHIIV